MRDLKARGEPVSAAEAVAAFGMLRREYFPHLGEYESTFEDAMLALADAVQAYLARAASSSEEVRS